MDRNATLRWILERDEVFRYQLLSRMKMDCEFFLVLETVWKNTFGRAVWPFRSSV